MSRFHDGARFGGAAGSVLRRVETRLTVAAHGEAIVLRVARGDLEILHRFRWDAANVKWEDGERELFEVLGSLLDDELYAAASR